MTREQAEIALRWRIARETGWTLEYIRTLSPGTLWEYRSLIDAESQISEAMVRDAKSKSKRRR